MADQETLNKQTLPTNLQLSKLTIKHIKQIDEMLDEIGKYGEVHIIVQNGELRYINKVESYRLWGRENNE